MMQEQLIADWFTNISRGRDIAAPVFPFWAVDEHQIAERAQLLGR